MTFTPELNSERCGRYAPSPTGELHLGNLRTAMLAWLHSRLQGGRFILRMEDLDIPRNVPGSADQIIKDLEWLGIDWEGEVVYQSQREMLYSQALDFLTTQELVFPCFCSRRDIQTASSAPHISTGVYPGTCRSLSEAEIRQRAKGKHPALRLKVSSHWVEFDDACLGPQRQNLAEQVGDFVIRRADKLFAYQLAVVVDDIDQGVTDVVRGADLIDSTARQIYLGQLLGAEGIRYSHVPLLMDGSGSRMSKRDGSQSIRVWQAESKTAEQMIGVFAHSLNLVDNADPVSLQELSDELDFESFLTALKRERLENADEKLV